MAGVVDRVLGEGIRDVYLNNNSLYQQGKTPQKHTVTS